MRGTIAWRTCYSYKTTFCMVGQNDHNRLYTYVKTHGQHVWKCMYNYTKKIFNKTCLQLILINKTETVGTENMTIYSSKGMQCSLR